MTIENNRNALTEESVGWENLTAGTSFVVDLGFSPDEIVNTEEGAMPLQRYAAFLPIQHTNRHQIVEVSHDLNMLKSKYKIKDDLVLQVGDGSASNMSRG